MQFLNCQKDNSGLVVITIFELSKAQCNNTDYSNTNHIYSEDEEFEERESYRLYFNEKLSVENLKNDNPYDEEIIDGIMELILDTVCSHKKTIHIAGEEKSVNVVKSRF